MNKNFIATDSSQFDTFAEFQQYQQSLNARQKLIDLGFSEIEVHHIIDNMENVFNILKTSRVVRRGRPIGALNKKPKIKMENIIEKCTPIMVNSETPSSITDDVEDFEAECEPV